MGHVRESPCQICACTYRIGTLRLRMQGAQGPIPDPVATCGHLSTLSTYMAEETKNTRKLDD
jgi:hypothetical protein